MQSRTVKRVSVAYFLAIVGLVIFSAVAYFVWPVGIVTDMVVDTKVIAAEIHRLVNIERDKAGVNELSYRVDLERVAQLHSDDMARRGYFDHVSPEGVSNIDRFNDAGLDCLVIFADRTRTNGSENLAELSGHSGIAGSAVNAWMASTAGHRENMLAEYWSSEGIGIAFNSAGTAYITQAFCT